ncbi:MAG: type II/IV secretion system protein [Chloroflexi bacterium]|nr:type II/IV secretion system protein [Chloroflexota bacterium]
MPRLIYFCEERVAILTEKSRPGVLKHASQPEALKLIPEVMARKYVAMPISVNGNALQVALANPADILALEALATHSHMRIEPEIATVEEILEAIDFNYKNYEQIEKQISNISLPTKTIEERIRLDAGTEAPIAQVLSLIIDEAVKGRASDIHFQPQEAELRVRYRIDGTLHDMFSLPLAATTPLISRIKILANMNIADPRRPQDGQFSLDTKGRLLDVRVGTTPTVYGEMAALRLLDKSRVSMDLSELGFLDETLAKYQKMLKVPYGMILVSGPTGAGKTTTLYASVNRMDRMAQNIITIEDPVEYRFKNINQVQVNARSGITFSSGLRSILRLDPDVILVGEIRDAETANIAVQSALTGHLVLSSIHANDAVGVIIRLFDLGIEPFLVSSALIGVVAQRMVRLVCPDCGRLVEAPLMERVIYQREINEERSEFMYGSGCTLCANTGYRGRTGIFEILTMSDDIRMMIVEGAPITKLRMQAIKEGMVTLMQDGMLKVQANVTNPAEVLRNTYSME